MTARPTMWRRRFAPSPTIPASACSRRTIAASPPRRNRAIGHARAPLIALLDGDDLHDPDYLAVMVPAIEADARLGFVSCDALYFGDDPRAGRRFSEFSPQVPPVTLARVLRREFNVFTACILRKAAFDAVDGYDGTLRAAEDFDLWLRLLEAGWRGDYVPRPLARYRRRAGSLSRQTVALMAALARVYRSAAVRLGDSPEGKIAEEMRARIEREAAWDEGDALIRAGRVREGLRVLRAARAWERSGRWRLAMPLMMIVPALARPILRGRQRWNEPS